MSANLTTLDVREDIRAGREPFSKIMAAAAGLSPQESLLIIAPFEPAPLFHVLAKQGFAHESKQTAPGEWQVLFSRPVATVAVVTPAATAPTAGCACDAGAPAEIVEVDVRGLEPPQPLVMILEAISAFPPGATLRARTDRRPMHLYAQLEARGFAGESTEQADGSYITQIRRC
jgi:uncharacterized protein (DUF2249 family)